MDETDFRMELANLYRQVVQGGLVLSRTHRKALERVLTSQSYQPTYLTEDVTSGLICSGTGQTLKRVDLVSMSGNQQRE